MKGICQLPEADEDGVGPSGGRTAEGVRGRRAMKGTIDIREAEVQESPQVSERAVPVSSLERLMTAPVQVRPMFADSLLRYEGQKGRQTFATLVSFLLQCLMLGVLLLIPLYFTEQ